MLYSVVMSAPTVPLSYCGKEGVTTEKKARRQIENFLRQDFLFKKRKRSCNMFGRSNSGQPWVLKS
jgi:hypothetical protein